MAQRSDPEATIDELSWLQDASCVQAQLDIAEFFVEAGHSIDARVYELCSKCNVRTECLVWAYARNNTAGYFGGLSAGQRRQMTLDEALEFIKNEHH